jgi:leader peptidase (prepilin peptidase)/N-methyltransferase
MIRILGTVFATLFGLAFGSFLNVCLYRWPRELSVTAPRSYCPHCHRQLLWWENIPLLSFIILRGRCRTCHAPIRWRYPLVELAVASLWALNTWALFPALQGSELHSTYSYITIANGFGRMIFYWMVVALAALDLESLWLPNILTLTGLVIGFALNSFTPVLRYLAPPSRYKFTAGFEIEIRVAGELESILAAAALILLIRGVYWLIRRREGIGLGDAKLMALLAAWLGLPGALLSFAIGVLLGALTALVLLAIPRKQSTTWAMHKLPLGTFLCIGGIVSSLWGQQILAAYLRWANF